jgi:Domain of unknown function (DUF4384)
VPFKHDGVKALFTLPNGFLAYSLNDARGDRLDISPDAIEREEMAYAGPVENGASCMSCHRTGPIAVTDVVRQALSADPAALREMRDAILALYAPAAEMDTLIAEDQERYSQAQRKAGIDPMLLIHGLEPVAALARMYTGPVGVGRLAAESGLSSEAVRDRLTRLPPELALSGQRLRASTASRSEADQILVRLAPDGGTQQPGAKIEAAPAIPARAGLELLLWSAADTYETGKLATFHARTNQDCYLTLVSLDRAGQATVLFPNEFEQNNLLTAGRDMMLPGEGAPYQFRLRDKGFETLVGICNTVSKVPEGIQHDFERIRFTMLGDWRAHLAQAPGGQAVGGQAPGEQNRASGTSVEAGRSRAQRRARAAAAEASAVKAGPEMQARTAIVYEVR